MFDLVHAYTSFLGHTGYAAHSREFFTALNKLISVRVKNYAHVSDLSYLTEEQKNMVIHQTWATPPFEVGKPFNPKDHSDILTIVLNETNHYYFYEDIKGPKIAFNVWESTLQPDQFFRRLLEFNQLWVPTKWQKECSIKQGYPADRVFVVPEAVNPEFFPEVISDKPEDYNDGRFKFIIFGRWDYRKSITEMIKSFLEEFKKDEPVDLIISVDNPFSVDGLKSTEERLTHHKFLDERIKIKHFVPWKDYVKYIKCGHCFLSCSRSEGWNIPLIEALASGTPAIFSNWGAQLEFANGIGFPVKIIGERPARFGEGSSFSGNIHGNYCEPDFKDLKSVMRYVFTNYEKCKDQAIQDSKIIRRIFTWSNAAMIAYDTITKFWSDYYLPRTTSGKRLTFGWNGKEEKHIVASIRDGYTGLNYYKCNMDLKPGHGYWVEHGYDVKNKVFELHERDTGKLLCSEVSNHGKNDLSNFDKEKHLKKYSEVISDEATIALPLYEIFVDNIYNHKFCNISKGDIVVDIGASLGFFSLYAYYQGCKISYSFEPIKKLYDAISKQLKNISTLDLENKAVDNFTGKAKIYIPKQESIGSSLYDPSKKYNKPQTTEICDVISFMEMVKEKKIEKIDFLKLDCEGSEYNIIEAIPDEYLKNNIRKIAIEFHNNSGQLKKTLDRLESLGFEFDFRNGSRIDGELGIVYIWKKFNFELFIKPYEEDLKRTGESRYNFYKYIIPKLLSKQKPLYIVETGTMWADLKDNMGAFTLVFSDLIKNWTGGKITTIDISEENINKCKNLTKEFSDIIEYINSDSITYLKSLSDNDIEKVDLFYLDSYDLNATNQEPSAKHHLGELESIYNKLRNDTIIAVDDNYLPGTEIQWNWLNSDGSIKNSEMVYTGEKIIGKGSLVNHFLLNRGWKRISEFDVGGKNNVFYYERNKLSKEKVSEILNNFYLSRAIEKTKTNPFSHRAISSKERGLGDTVILTPFTEYKMVDSLSPTFPTLMMYNKNFESPIFSSIPKNEFIDISEYSKYNWGGGHAIQKIARALNIPEMKKPKGTIDINRQIIKGRIGFHLTKDKENQHTLNNKDIEIFNEFMRESNYEFVDLSKINDLRNLIETIATCEFFIGINSGPMHIATALDIKSIVIVNNPHYSELYLPKISEVAISESEWLYPQNVHLHTRGSNELVPLFNKINLKNAISGNIYPFWSDEYLDIKEDDSKTDYNITTNFVNGAFAEITGNDRGLFKIEFLDNKTNKLVYSGSITANHWLKTYRRYYTDWLIKIYRNEKLITANNFNLEGRKVYIHLDSKSIGDTIAWFPYVEEFRKVHKCKVVCSTFWNDLFKRDYKEIEFVNPGSVVNDILAMYSIGWWDKDKEEGHLRPSNPRSKPLQQTASDILGLPYNEIAPKIYVRNKKRSIKEKYVCVSSMSTAGCKLWLYDNGWQTVVDYLNDLGFKVVIVQKEPTNLKNIINKTGKDDLQESISLIYNCEFFIGLASGLSWISWALGKKSIMIAGFTDTYTEYQKNCYRIINKDVCYGCWNDPTLYPFDKGDWNWCPKHKGTERHFECSKKISPDMIKSAIEKILGEK